MSYDIAEITAAFGGRFAISGVIGSGGQGVVFKACRSMTPFGEVADELVAIKLLTDANQGERWQREMTLLDGIRHPSLADVIEHGVISLPSRGAPVVHYAVFRFVAGESLGALLASGPIDPRIVVAVGRDIASAVAEIWNRKIVHRDIKPDNIMLHVGFRDAVLIDLGIARHLELETITGDGLTWGTRGYMSPEQARGERQLTCGSDIYAIGIVLLECLMGRHPFDRDQTAMLQNPISAQVLAPSSPGRLTALIDRMISQRAAFRPSPTAVADLLRTITIN